jgi:hypothetical protein
LLGFLTGFLAAEKGCVAEVPKRSVCGTVLKISDADKVSFDGAFLNDGFEIMASPQLITIALDLPACDRLEGTSLKSRRFTNLQGNTSCLCLRYFAKP